MIKPEDVPKESLVAYQRAFKAGGGPSDAIAAALNAWPGMSQLADNDSASIREMAALILPLPTEADNDKA